MSRWLYILLLGVPATLLAEALGAAPLVIFLTAALGLIPLAGLIGTATEALAERINPQAGGLLNATFGNAAEIIIGIAGLAAGLPDVVRASLAGSIIGNVLLVLGTSMLVGGWRFGRQHFDARTAGQYASMLALVVIGLTIPTLLATVGEGPKPGTLLVRGLALDGMSLTVAVVLLICYVAYLAFSVFGVHAAPPPEPAGPAEAAMGFPRESELADGARGGDGAAGAAGADETDGAAQGGQGSSAMVEEKLPAEGAEGRASLSERAAVAWERTIWLPLGLLAVVTALTAVMSEALVGAIEPVAHEVGLNPFFVGLIVLPIVGNAAEHFTAVTMATRNHLEVTMAITAGSSIQIALLATPILVLVSPLLGHTLDLTFTLLEVAVFALAAGLYALISLDGESNWLEGFMLCAFYVILAVGVFFTPS
jgi:Ca2+:H+ antiporter